MLRKNSAGFAPIRILYEFDLFLTEQFAGEAIKLTELESKHLRSQVAVGKEFPTVSATFEDWRSHLVVKVKEGSPLSQGDVWNGVVRAPVTDGPDWAYERRTGEQLIYAPDFGGCIVWRRFLSPERETYLELDLTLDAFQTGVKSVDVFTDCCNIRLAAFGGRFASFLLPHKLGIGPENEYLELRLSRHDLAISGKWGNKYAASEPRRKWEGIYEHIEPNGLQWRFSLRDLESYLRGEEED